MISATAMAPCLSLSYACSQHELFFDIAAGDLSGLATNSLTDLDALLVPLLLSQLTSTQYFGHRLPTQLV